MHSEGKAEDALYVAARHLVDPTARAAFLDAACAGNPALRERLEKLLSAGPEADEFFSRNAVDLSRLPTRSDEDATLVIRPNEQSGERIGRYKLLQPLGEGGMGAVWMAEQREPMVRRVALKIIKQGMDTREVIARFEAERQALAMMDHPCIAKVFDAGATESGRPFFVMELVRGVPITTYCDEQKLGVRERLALFIQVCQAVQHAHQKGIIHRDLKPSNILVTAGDDSEPLPKVIDFGIAKATGQALTDRTLFTQLAQIIGTPAYMSPEQAGLGPLDIDTRSDIYSLGVLLYELLTGRPPFDPRELISAGLDEMRRVIREKEPPRPSTRISSLSEAEGTRLADHCRAPVPRLVSLVRGDLDWIVMKALDKNRNRRYESATSLAADIQRHMAAQPVLARPPGAGYLLSRFVKRHKFGFAAGTAVALALVGGITAATWGLLQARTEKTTAGNERDKAVFFAEQSSDQLADGLYHEAQSWRLSERPGRRGKALSSIQKCELLMSRNRPAGFKRPDFPTTADLRSEVLAALQISGAEIGSETLISTSPASTVLNENGRIAVGMRVDNFDLDRFQKGDFDGMPGSLVFHDAINGAELMKLEGINLLYSTPALSPDGKFAAVATPRGDPQKLAKREAPDSIEVIIYDLATKEPVKRLPWPRGAALTLAAMPLSYSPDGTLLANNPHEPNTDVMVWDLVKGMGEVVGKTGETGEKTVAAFAAFTRDGKRIIFPAADKKLAVCELGGATKEITLAMSFWEAPAIDKRGPLVAMPMFASEGGKLTGKGAVLILDLDGGEPKHLIPLEYWRSRCAAAFSGDGRLAFSDGPVISVFDLLTSRVTMRINEGGDMFPEIIEALAWDDDAHYLTAVASDGIVRRLEVNEDMTEKPIGSLHLSGKAGACSVSADGAWFAFATDKGIALEARRPGLQSRTLTIPGETAYQLMSLAFRGDSAQLAAVDYGKVVIFDTATGALAWRTMEDGKYTMSIAYTADNHLLAARHSDGHLHVDDLTANREVWRGKRTAAIVILSSDALRFVEFPPPGDGSPVRVIEVATSRVLATVPLHGLPIPQYVGESRTRFALPTIRKPEMIPAVESASRIGQGIFGVALWDTSRGIEVADFPGALRGVFSADEKLLALGSVEGHIEIRNAIDGALLFRWGTGRQPLSPLAFSADGSALIASDQQKSMQMLDLTAVRRKLSELKLDW